jgi:hypothetical protein
VKVKINWRSKLNLSQVQKFIDSSVLKGIEPYIPMRTSAAKKSGIQHTVIGSGTLIWKTPYIRRIYYGWIMEGRAPMRVTDRQMTYHGGGLRGAKWCERYKADHLKELQRLVAKKIRGEMKNG